MKERACVDGRKQKLWMQKTSFLKWMTHEFKSNKTFAKEYMSGNGVHLAKERVTGIVFAGWAVQKDSHWTEALNKYILQLDQVLKGCVIKLAHAKAASKV